MDQERDTTKNAKSSRRGPFWVENTLPNKASGARPESGTNSGREPYSGFHEISAASAARIDAASVPAGEPLPTLFELPDRTPAGLERKRQKNQFVIHDAHAGPPASHVDPPSGNHSFLRHPGPKSPISTDSIAAEDSPELGHSLGDDPRSDTPGNSASGTPASDAPDERRVAAYRDEPMKWSEENKASLGTRSAIVMLVLMMVTLAFFSGRGFNNSGSNDEDVRLTDSEGNDLGETVVVISEDIELIDDMIRREAEVAVNDPPSYAAQPPAVPTPPSELAEPDLGFDPTDKLKAQIATDLIGQPELPSAFDSLDSTVAYRSPATETSNDATHPDTFALGTPSAQSPNADAMPPGPQPTGMEGTLRLGDLYQYSDTPHMIGNFLEILRVWEATNL